MARKLVRLGLARQRGYVFVIGLGDTIVVEKRPVRSVRPTPVLPHLEPDLVVVLDTGLRKRRGEFYFIDRDGDLSVDMHPRFVSRMKRPAVERRDPAAPLPASVVARFGDRYHVATDS